MLFKILLIVLMLAMLLSLSAALRAVLKESTDDKAIKSVNWLAVRVSLAIAIFAVTAIGLWTGELTVNAPWAGQY